MNYSLGKQREGEGDIQVAAMRRPTPNVSFFTGGEATQINDTNGGMEEETRVKW